MGLVFSRSLPSFHAVLKNGLVEQTRWKDRVLFYVGASEPVLALICQFCWLQLVTAVDNIPATPAIACPVLWGCACSQ